jgi:hypothetical protein
MRNAFQPVAGPVVPAKTQSAAESAQKPIATRLEILSRDLADLLRRSSVDRQRKAGEAACEFAVAHTQIEHPVVREALARIRSHEAFTGDQKVQVEALRAEMDEESLERMGAADHGRGAANERQRAHARARAISAISFAGGTDPYLSAAEAIYEAAFTTADQNEIVAIIEAVLK